MLRQTAVDMENTEMINKDDGYSMFYHSKKKNLGLGCCLILCILFLCIRVLWRIYE